MLLEDNTNINEKLENDATPLFQGAQNSHIDLCTVLLEHNENVTEKTEDGATPLFQAVQNSHVDVKRCCSQTKQI